MDRRAAVVRIQMEEEEERYRIGGMTAVAARRRTDIGHRCWKADR